MSIARLIGAGAIALIAGGVFSGSAVAQYYRGKTITVIINYPPGGANDIEGRIIARHLPKHIAGKPRIIVKNTAGGGGNIGVNYLGEIAKPDGLTMGYVTWNVIAALLGDPGLRVRYSDLVLIAGVPNPIVFYARRDTPPGLKQPADIVKAKPFKALSLDTANTNTVHQALAFDIIGAKYIPVAGYRGLKEVETAVLQGEGQAGNISLPGWEGSSAPALVKTGVALPLWQLNGAGPDGSITRFPAIPDIPTFEEVYQQVHGKKPSGIEYETMRLLIDSLTNMFRTAFMPPKTPAAAVKEMRAAFVTLFQDREFLGDYTRAVRTEPRLVKGEDGEKIMARLAGVKPEIKSYLAGYLKKLEK